jgi:CO/xanthine dehydrogenase Mo-binding subunit
VGRGEGRQGPASDAVFDAIGVRLRSVPFTGPKVMAAVRGAGGKA